MNIRSISFKVGPPRSGSGFPLPTNSNIPKMRGRKPVDLQVEIQHLDTALKLLSGIECSFWACKGPSYPRNMITCSKCYAIREIASVKASLMRWVEEVGE